VTGKNEIANNRNGINLVELTCDSGVLYYWGRFLILSKGFFMTERRAPHRRQVLQQLGCGVGAMGVSAWLPASHGPTFAEELAATPQMTEGPFYPDKMPLDTDNDLLIINDSINAAVGEVTHLTGRILNKLGEPIRNAFVEIWQVDNSGVYLHSADQRIRDKRDSNFQGYGRFLTDSKGQYYFRTIKPVPYTGRTPHIHVGVSRNGKRIYTTQLFIQGHEQNERDGIYRSLGSEEAKKLVTVDFKPLAGSKIGELTANFDVILGKTFQEHEDEKIRGGIGKSAGGGFGGPPGKGPPPPRPPR
jgi:protocatechuate 3,4-dioxygenase beta subunit